MAVKSYPVTHAKVGNQDGFRLPRAFSKDYPHLANASGHIEVLSDNTFLVRLETDNINEADGDEGIMMSLFLDFLMKDAMQNPSKLVPYTQEMSDEMDDLLADVVID
ncbi:AbrB/MazE/SpoVT family DNA-binding domain-containing protein [Nostoc sp.]